MFAFIRPGGRASRIHRRHYEFNSLERFQSSGERESGVDEWDSRFQFEFQGIKFEDKLATAIFVHVALDSFRFLLTGCSVRMEHPRGATAHLSRCPQLKERAAPFMTQLRAAA
jgi:hypothetical protein